MASISVLGGAMAYCSGYLAAQALTERRSPEELAHLVNVGLGRGFIAGGPLAAWALIIEVCL